MTFVSKTSLTTSWWFPGRVSSQQYWQPNTPVHNEIQSSDQPMQLCVDWFWTLITLRVQLLQQFAFKPAAFCCSHMFNICSRHQHSETKDEKYVRLKKKKKNLWWRPHLTSKCNKSKPLKNFTITYWSLSHPATSVGVCGQGGRGVIRECFHSYPAVLPPFFCTVSPLMARWWPVGAAEKNGAHPVNGALLPATGRRAQLISITFICIRPELQRHKAEWCQEAALCPPLGFLPPSFPLLSLLLGRQPSLSLDFL